jgi:hypothetical protein
VDAVVARYLDCGVWETGFARVRCRRCPEEFLVACTSRTTGSFWVLSLAAYDGMALAPDQRSILLSTLDSAGSNLMLVDQFP